VSQEKTILLLCYMLAHTMLHVIISQIKHFIDDIVCFFNFKNSNLVIK